MTYKYCLSKELKLTGRVQRCSHEHLLRSAHSQEIFTHRKYTFNQKHFFSQRLKNISTREKKSLTSQQHFVFLSSFFFVSFSGSLEDGNPLSPSLLLTVLSLNQYPGQHDQGCSLLVPLMDPHPHPGATAPAGCNCQDR